MTLQRIQTLYYIVAISIALILVGAAGLIGWVAAVIVLAGARPMFRAVEQVVGDKAADETLKVVERHLTHRDR